MKQSTRIMLFMAFLLLAVSGMALGLDPKSVPRISCDELNAEMEKKSVTVLDVRTEGDWMSSQLKIPGAIHEPASNVESWMSKYGKDQKLVLYCA